MCEMILQAQWVPGNTDKCLLVLPDKHQHCLWQCNLPNHCMSKNNIIDHIPQEPLEVLLWSVNDGRADSLWYIFQFIRRNRIYHILKYCREDVPLLLTAGRTTCIHVGVNNQSKLQIQLLQNCIREYAIRAEKHVCMAQNSSTCCNRLASMSLLQLSS